MKVPKMYKSSDRYNAGTDVIYNDESKLQYAPFIYAGVTAKDNGDGGGDDEEGEDTMVVIYDSQAGTINKSFKDLKDALDAGKIVTMPVIVLDAEGALIENVYYLVGLSNMGIEEDKVATFGSISVVTDVATPQIMTFTSSTDTDNMDLKQ